LAILELKTLLEQKTVVAELGESQPMITRTNFGITISSSVACNIVLLYLKVLLKV
jgi:hypothetical protein